MGNRLKLRPDRKYRRVGRNLLRVKQAPPASKRCRVHYKGWPCGYDKTKRTLEVVPAVVAGENIGATIFPSKHKAQAAVWRSVQANGIPGDHVNYAVEEVWGE